MQKDKLVLTELELMGQCEVFTDATLIFSGVDLFGVDT